MLKINHQTDSAVRILFALAKRGGVQVFEGRAKESLGVVVVMPSFI
jgi:hypothetical protein